MRRTIQLGLVLTSDQCLTYASAASIHCGLEPKHQYQSTIIIQYTGMQLHPTLFHT